MNPDGTINELGGKYAGLDRYQARKAIVEDLEKEGYLVKIKAHEHNVGSHDRCSTVIEPMISKQWYVRMESLAKPAIEAVRNGKTKFVPERFEKYTLTDGKYPRLCISRQLWWGHRIPVWYCKDCGEIIVAEETPKACCKCVRKSEAG